MQRRKHCACERATPAPYQLRGLSPVSLPRTSAASLTPGYCSICLGKWASAQLPMTAPGWKHPRDCIQLAGCWQTSLPMWKEDEGGRQTWEPSWAAAAHHPSARCLALDSMLSSHVRLHPLRGTLASSRTTGGHPRCPKSSRGHHIPEENHPWLCASPSCPRQSWRFIAHLCKAPRAACDLPLASDGALGFKIHTQ